MTLREEVQQQIQYASEATLERIKSLLEEYNSSLGGKEELLERLADESELGLIQERLLEPKISMAEMMAELRADGVL
jgi:hypothetical protein